MGRSVNIADKTTLDRIHSDTTALRTVAGIPAQAGSLTYTGSVQSPSWVNYNPDMMTVSGDTSATAAGTYTAIFTLKEGFTWSDGTTEPKNVSWTLSKALGYIEVSESLVELNANKMMAYVTINRAGTGAISIENSNKTGLTATLSGNSVLLYAIGNGSSNVTVKVAADDNYEAAQDKVIVVDINLAKVYGVRIAKNDANPYTRVTYTDDAVGMIPAQMNFKGGVFNYGSWADAFFVKENYPCMLNNDGTVAYKLDPNDLTKKLSDGSASDVANTAFNGNAMSAIPLTYVYAYEEGEYEYIKISNSKIDDNYHAIAHTRADGTVMKEIFLSIYKGSYIDGKVRSLSDQVLMRSKDAQTEMNGAMANGTNWNVRTWGQRTLINYMLVILGKSTDSQTVYGQGNTTSYVEDPEQNYGMIMPGATMNKRGQFWGSDDKVSQVKVFFMEDWWGNQWERIAGLILDNGVYKVSLTGPYNMTADGYTEIPDLVAPENGYIKDNLVTPYGRFPKTTGGSSTTYDCDSYNLYRDFRLPVLGGSNTASLSAGAFILHITMSVSGASKEFGACLSFV